MVNPLASSPSGQLVPTVEGQQAFVPGPLPRSIELSPSMVYRLDEATRAVAILAGVGETIPNPHLLIRPFIRREAVLSSRIEGTQASMSELFLYEAAGSRRSNSGDVRGVANYVRAIEHGIDRLESLPISLRLVNEMHLELMRGVRGEETRPGELRSSQVWIGPAGTPIEESRYVPPPPDRLRDLFLDWERFVNEPMEMPPLVQCALMHYQFEAIHPYLDGNGRIGRLLVVLFLCAKKILTTPLLYLSVYFEKTHDLYYDQLFRVSETGDWQSWIDYFLKRTAEQARDALLRSRRARELLDRYRPLLQDRRASGNTLRLLDELFASPFMTAPRAAQILGITDAGARGILQRLVDARIVEESTDHWPHMYIAIQLLDIFEAPMAANELN